MPIILNNTNKSLVVELTESPTNQPDYVCTYMDRGVSGAYEGSSDGTLVDATTTTIVPAPSASDMTRTIRYISVHNTETASPITLTFKLSNDTNKRIIRKVNIQAGSTIVYHDDQWTTYNYSEITSDGWIAAGEVWTYASADSPTFTFTISGDKTGKYQAGQRLKLTQTTVKYFIVTKVAYSAPDTTITCYGGTSYTLANAVITDPFFSREKAPFGFPLSPASWQVTWTDTSSTSQATPVQNTWYNVGGSSFSVPIGVWDLGYYVTLYTYNQTDNLGADINATLSTANNSESDGDFTARTFVLGTIANNDSYVLTSVSRFKIVAVTTKTTYYLNSRTTSATNGTLYFQGPYGSTRLIARCAYL